MTASLLIVTVVALLAIAVEADDIWTSTPESYTPTVPRSRHTFTPSVGMFVDVKSVLPVTTRLVTVPDPDVICMVKPSRGLFVEL